MSDKLKTLNDLLHEQLRDLYSAEDQLIDALPDMADEANDPRLKQAFQLHLEQTKNQKARLEEIGRGMNLDLDGHKCKAMEGLIKEGKDMIDEDATDEVKDAGLIAAAQRIEHYEISGYGTAARFAEQTNNAQTAELLRQTLQEEQDTDTKLNDLAESYINQKAM